MIVVALHLQDGRLGPRWAASENADLRRDAEERIAQAMSVQNTLYRKCAKLEQRAMAMQNKINLLESENHHLRYGNG